MEKNGTDAQKIAMDLSGEFGEGELAIELWRYQDINGDSGYSEYKKTQTAGNEKKIDRVWVLEDNIRHLSDYILKKIERVEFGVCHGTRRGNEQRWFRRYLDCEVIGTEISSTATNFRHTIEWDFHEVRADWLNSLDFVYSNSFDHAYDPKSCLDSWMSCLKSGGLCVIEHTSNDEIATELDPFGAELSVMPQLISAWGEGKYGVTDIFDTPSKHDFLNYCKHIVVQHTL